MTDEEIEAEFEITMEAYKHLESLTQEYTSNVHKLYSTYPTLAIICNIVCLFKNNVEETRSACVLEGERSRVQKMLKEEYDELDS